MPSWVLVSLVLVPALSGLASFALRRDGPRRGLLVGAALAHSALTSVAWAQRSAASAAGDWFALDAPGLFFLSVSSALFLLAAIYAAGFLRREGAEGSGGRRGEGAAPFTNASEAAFTGCLLLFLATMTLVSMSQHFGFLWVAVEATTLASAPLIYFHRQTRSLEATWKYLVVCSVGIALALLGNFFLAVAATTPFGEPTPLVLGRLMARGGELHIPWLKAAFLFFLVGYGTKMGLAPLHTWLPDAHSEAPAVVSALLSGALLNCAFLGILRAQQVCAAAGQSLFGQELLQGFGLLSMGLAGAFILGQADYKRMLAYSSVEHMGILALGVGLGGTGTFGAMLHAMNHSLAKAMLFFVSGNILAIYRTKSAADVRGLTRILPASGVLWVAGFLAITGSPPFGLFLSEFTILRAALTEGRPAVAVLYLAFLALIFVGMATIFLRMAQGAPSPGLIGRRVREPLLSVLPPAVLGAMVLALGVYVPPAVDGALREVARVLGGSG